MEEAGAAVAEHLVALVTVTKDSVPSAVAGRLRRCAEEVDPGAEEEESAMVVSFVMMDSIRPMDVAKLKNPRYPSNLHLPNDRHQFFPVVPRFAIAR